MSNFGEGDQTPPPQESFAAPAVDFNQHDLLSKAPDTRDASDQVSQLLGNMRGDTGTGMWSKSSTPEGNKESAAAVDAGQNFSQAGMVRSLK